MLTYDLEKRGNRTLYEFLYENVKEDILSGRIQSGTKLPSKRAFAEHLKVSIKTVENAYAQLLLEGYIISKEKKGYFVNKVGSGKNGATPAYASFVTKFKEEEYLADFTANNSNVSKFPFSTWAKVMRETLTDYDTTLLKTIPFNGAEKLRLEIAEYLYRYRGMQVSPDHIIIGAGTEYLYNRLLQLLGRDARYAIENPGYQKIALIYKAYNAEWTPIDVDDHGLDVQLLRKTNANVVHVSPGHHYPMGFVMPIGRRQELLDWAYEEKERYIIEDDFDCEFRIAGRPIPALQSMDTTHRVIYMNTFSKTLIPSIRVSYMVLPEKLMERYISTMNFYSCTVSGFEQYTLAAFLEKGYFERHIRRMVTYYRQQCEKIKRIFKDSALKEISEIIEADAGTHFLLKVNTHLNDIEIKWAAKERGILLNCLSEYCFENKPKYSRMLIINYSVLEEEQLQKVITALEDIFIN